MKNKSIFLKIYIVFIIILAISIIILYVLGKKERIGYLSDFEINVDKTLEINGLDSEETKKLFIIEDKLDETSINNFLFTNISITNYSYNFRIKYYNKVFRNSDIYDVYIDTTNLMKGNNFIKDININNGSPFGNFISTNIIDTEKIDNVNYSLRLKYKNILILFLIIVLFIVIFICKNNIYFFYIKLYGILFKNKKLILKKYNILKSFFNNNIVYYILIILICIFAIYIRMYLAEKKITMFWDEKYSVLSSNNSLENYYGYYTNLNNTLGEDVFKDNYYNDPSIKDVVNDIKALYIDSKDPFISNLYYSLLRIAFACRVEYKINEIVFVASILNCIFFVISYIFLFKLLKLIFKNSNNKKIILFSLLIMSINPMSISFSIFLRPYQMQETFLISILYIVLNTIINNKYSIINFIYTTIISGIGYLILSSSLLFILVLSFILFLYYVLGLLKNEHCSFFKITIRTLVYYCIIFNLGLIVSQLLYSKFFSMLFSSTGRTGIHLFSLSKLFYYINTYTFYDFLPYLIIGLLIIIVIAIKKRYIYDNNAINILIFIVLFGVIASIVVYIGGSHDDIKYSANGYVFILFIIPLFLFLIKKEFLKECVFIILAINAIINSTDPTRLYFSNSFIDTNIKENIDVYFYDTQIGFIDWWHIDEINTNSYYYYTTNTNNLIMWIDNKHPKSFYVVINTNNTNILNNFFSDNYNIMNQNLKLFYDLDEARELYKLVKK